MGKSLLLFLVFVSTSTILGVVYQYTAELNDRKSIPGKMLAVDGKSCIFIVKVKGSPLLSWKMVLGVLTPIGWT